MDAGDSLVPTYTANNDHDLCVSSELCNFMIAHKGNRSRHGTEYGHYAWVQCVTNLYNTVNNMATSKTSKTDFPT